MSVLISGMKLHLLTLTEDRGYDNTLLGQGYCTLQEVVTEESGAVVK